MKVVMTGATGGVGQLVRPHLRGRFDRLLLTGRKAITDLEAGEDFAAADITDLAATESLLAGADGVIHLAGQAVESDWQTILDANIIGLYNVYEAARRQGVRRIVFASTNHVVGFYRRQRIIDDTAPPRPDSRYGASKVFGEALGRLYADKHGLRVFNIRIGNVAPAPIDTRRLSIWVSPRDLAQLMRIGLEHPDVHYEVVYGASENARAWWDNANARRLGYAPEDRGEPFAAQAHAFTSANPEDPIGAQFQGGAFAAQEFDGDSERIT